MNDSEYEQEQLGAAQEQPVFTKLYGLSEPDKEDALKQQQARLDASKRYMEKLWTPMVENYKKYRSIADPIKDELGNEVKNRANLYIPYPWAIVESELPRLAGKLPKTRCFPRREVNEAQVMAAQDLIYYAMDRMKFLKLQTLWMRQFSIYGWSPLYVYWRTETRNVLARSRVPVPGYAGLTAYPVERKQVEVYNDFWAKVLDVFDCFLQPGVTEPETGDWFMFREWLSRKDIENNIRNGLFYPEVAEYIKENASGVSQLDESAGRAERDALVGQDRDYTTHCYGKYEVMYSLEDTRIVAMINRSKLAMVGDNHHPLQKKPIINMNLLQLVSEPIGISTIESLAGLPDKQNALSNARLDNIAHLLEHTWLANRLSNTEWDTVHSDVGNIIFTDDIERSLKPLEFQDLAQSTEREILQTKEDMQFVSGISDFGTAGSRTADTATGVSTISREQNARTGLKQASYEADPLRELVSTIFIYQQTYMPEERMIHVQGPAGWVNKRVTLNDILFEADFMVEPGSVVPIDQVLRREALSQLFERLKPMPQLVKMPKFAKELLEAHDIRNADEMIIVPEAPRGLQDEIAYAQAENTAISMGEPVAIVGNDEIHLQIHGQELQTKAQQWADKAFVAMLQEHLQGHEQHRMMVLQQQQMMAAQPPGGPNANAGRPGPPPGGPGAGPPMGPPAQVPGPPRGPVQPNMPGAGRGPS